MITPLAQRQMFQTANIEAVRAAHEVSDQIQREQSRKKTAEDRAAEDQASVRGIPASEQIRTEERERNRNQQREAEDEGEPQSGTDETAESADSHLDFLA